MRSARMAPAPSATIRGMKPSRFSLGMFFVAVSLLALGAAWLCAQRLHVSRVYNVTAHYRHMPYDDKPLENWLKVQPGVVAGTVHSKREGDELHVMCVMSQTVLGSPPFPELSDVCAVLGTGLNPIGSTTN